MENEPKEVMYCILEGANNFDDAAQAQVLIRPSEDETDLDDSILKELHEESNIGPLVDAVYDKKVAGTLVSVDDLIEVWKIAKRLRSTYMQFGCIGKMNEDFEALHGIDCWED